MVAMAAKMTPVPPHASMTSCGPFENPRTKLRSRDSIRPMKNAKASSNAMPIPLSFVRSIANMKPNAIARNPMKLKVGLMLANSEKLVATPSHAPNTVGTIDNASSQ